MAKILKAGFKLAGKGLKKMSASIKNRKNKPENENSGENRPEKKRIDFKGVAKKTGMAFGFGLALFGTIFSVVKTGKLKKAIEERDAAMGNMEYSISAMAQANQDLNSVLAGKYAELEALKQTASTQADRIEELEGAQELSKGAIILNRMLLELKHDILTNPTLGIVNGKRFGIDFEGQNYFVTAENSVAMMENGTVLAGATLPYHEMMMSSLDLVLANAENVVSYNASRGKFEIAWLQGGSPEGTIKIEITGDRCFIQLDNGNEIEYEVSTSAEFDAMMEAVKDEYLEGGIEQ